MSRLKKESKQTKERVPLGVRRLKLSAPERQGYVRRWVNDKVGRIEAALEGGYTFVRDPNAEKTHEPGVEKATTDIGTAMSRNVNTEKDLPQKAYLMEIKKSVYDKDQKEKQKAIDDTEKQIVDGSYDPGGLGKNRYTPQGGTSVTHH